MQPHYRKITKHKQKKIKNKSSYNSNFPCLIPFLFLPGGFLFFLLGVEGTMTLRLAAPHSPHPRPSSGGLLPSVPGPGASPRTPEACLHFATLTLYYTSKSLNVIFFLVYLFLAALGLHCCTRAFSSCGKWGLLFVVVRWLLLLRSMGSRCAGFSSCGTWAQ